MYLTTLLCLTLKLAAVIKNENDDSSESGTHVLQFKYHRSPSYLLALGYSEQISAGIYSVLQLSSLALDFKAHLVEPTVLTSHTFGIQGVYPKRYSKNISYDAGIKLFYLFDRLKINKVLHNNLSASVNMSTYTDFLRKAPGDIAIFHFSSSNLVTSDRLFTMLPKEEQELVNFFEKNPEKHILNCLNISGMQYISTMVERQLNIDGHRNRTRNMFKVSESYCLNHNHIYRTDQLFNYISEPRTIIFTNWGGCGLKDCTYGSKDVEREKEAISKVPSIRHAVLTRNKLDFNLKNESTLHHKRLRSIAKKYLKHLGYSPYEFISVHVRMERIVRHTMESKIQANYTKCLSSILGTINNILGSKASSGHRRHYQGSHQVLAMSDRPGLKFGTDSCFGRYCNKNEVKALGNTLKKGIDFYSFEPEVLDEVENAGLVALVEMHILSMGKQLVLVGFGGFQAVLKNLFLSLGHSEKDVHHVCDAH